MDAVREVTSIQLAQPLDLSAPEIAIPYKASIQALTRQPGFRMLYTAVAAQDPKFLVWIIDWTSLQHHEAFMAKKDQYAQMADPLFSLCDTKQEGFIHVRHLPLSSSSSPSSASGLSLEGCSFQSACEILWLRLNADSAAAVGRGGLRALTQQHFGEVAGGSGRGHSVYGGETVEDASGREVILFFLAAGSGGLDGSDGSDVFARGSRVGKVLTHGRFVQFTRYPSSLEMGDQI
ncbi:uncharacterized protein BO66DRAFT_457538 [Aspergillus aculeatinus CBS 121060]|uniref:Uncharacterized protein n=1 Tax=Aspergillus aculeatinus CBS 121060 TaxID=1448322 RepID=A0ACD1H1S1_9EURO|nr:hypothetical protein BO66DRAFT_457538 [Aspergillus aculeatinus CBS 121060]RAH67556.1 hypothetical protein BO66DRAFT_457538 [Aspergillus aculeatinus CBS 121060]